MDEDIKKGFKNSLGFGLGLILMAGILFGVYAFVEPSQAPSNNNVMTSFTGAQASLTSNGGMYDNRIPTGTYPNNYTMICFKGGTMKYDKMTGGSATSSGINCQPGDVGFIIEQNPRAAQYWTNAKIACTENGMRLPEPLEWQYACMNSATLGMNGMGTAWEWASNFALPMYSTNNGVGAAIMGTSGCNYATWGWVGYAAGGQVSHAFRCAK